MEVTHNVVGWFEIPVSDMERAMNFYQNVFGYQLNRQQMGPIDMALFPSEAESMGAAGALARLESHYTPSDKGTVIYLTAFSGDLANELSRVEDNGGKVLVEKTLIAEDTGYMGIFLDSEGNRIALHSRK